MKKGKIAVILSLVIAALAAFGVIDKETARDILSASKSETSTAQTQTPSVVPQSRNTSGLGKNEVAAKVSKKVAAKIQGWSNTQPQINLTHIFSGEINRRGKPTGFHSRPGGVDPKTARLDRIKGKANRVGVYTAQVSIYDREEDRWKSKFSTMFPNNMSHQQVIERIAYAYKNRGGSEKPWRGPSGKGFQIEGYLSRRGGINTAYPVYVRN